MAGRGLAGMAPATLYDWRDMDRSAAARHAALGASRLPAARSRSAGPRIRPISTRPSSGRACAPRLPATRCRAYGRRAARSPARPPSERRQLGASAADLIASLRHASRPSASSVSIRACFRPATTAAAVYALRILLATAGGVAFLPDQARSEALFDRLKAGSLCATLSRTVVDLRRAGIFLRREARGLPPPLRPSTTPSGTAAAASH